MAYVIEILDEAAQSGGVEAERRALAELAQQESHPTGIDLATWVMRDLISQGQIPTVSPILTAFRERDTGLLAVDEDDPFNKTFLSLLGCEDMADPTCSIVAYLGNCTVRLEAINHPDDYADVELDRLNPVPLPALRVVFEPIDT